MPVLRERHHGRRMTMDSMSGLSQSISSMCRWFKTMEPRSPQAQNALDLSRRTP